MFGWLHPGPWPFQEHRNRQAWQRVVPTFVQRRQAGALVRMSVAAPLVTRPRLHLWNRRPVMWAQVRQVSPAGPVPGGAAYPTPRNTRPPPKTSS